MAVPKQANPFQIASRRLLRSTETWSRCFLHCSRSTQNSAPQGSKKGVAHVTEVGHPACPRCGSNPALADLGRVAPGAPESSVCRPCDTIVYTQCATSGTNARTSRIGVSMESVSIWRFLSLTDEHRVIELNRVDEYGERRWHAIGAISIEPEFGLVVVVVHVYREDHDGEEIIRIIGARAASKSDVRRYREQEVD